MTTAFPYLIGAIAASIPWLAFSIWQQHSFFCKMLVEKEISFRAGFAHARNLMSGKPLDLEKPSSPTESSAQRQVLH